MLNKNLLTKTLIVTLALGLSACSNTEGLEASVTNLTNKVDALSDKVDNLSGDVAELKAAQQKNNHDIKAAKMAAEQAAIDAQQANERIDNVIATYKK